MQTREIYKNISYISCFEFSRYINKYTLRIEKNTLFTYCQGFFYFVLDYTIDNIILHLKSIFTEREMDEFSTTEESSVTAFTEKITTIR
jgi:hypothetical protein